MISDEVVVAEVTELGKLLLTVRSTLDTGRHLASLGLCHEE